MPLPAPTRAREAVLQPMTSSVLDAAWSEWRHAVIGVIRSEYAEVLDDVDEDDIDWDAWRPLYDEGLSPHAAVDHAFVRDL
jgi:hypothetical protein